MAFCQAAGVTEPQKIDLDLVRRYRLELNTADEKSGEPLLKKNTQNYHLIAVRNFLRYLATRDVPSLAAEKIELMEPEARDITILNLEQLEDILRRPDTTKLSGKRDKAILEVLFSTGLRVSELVSMDRNQMDLERREFSVVGKGRKRRVVFLSPRAAKYLQDWLEAREDSFSPVFIRLKGKRTSADPHGADLRLTVRTIQRLVRKYATMAGIVSAGDPAHVAPFICH